MATGRRAFYLVSWRNRDVMGHLDQRVEDVIPLRGRGRIETAGREKHTCRSDENDVPHRCNPPSRHSSLKVLRSNRAEAPLFSLILTRRAGNAVAAPPQERALAAAKIDMRWDAGISQQNASTARTDCCFSGPDIRIRKSRGGSASAINDHGASGFCGDALPLLSTTLVGCVESGESVGCLRLVLTQLNARVHPAPACG